MIVIGIHNTGIISSAALVVDGRLEFGCAEERLERRKHSKSFPHKAINSCLEWSGLKHDDVDCFAIGWNPAINIGSRYRAGFSEWPAYPGERFYSNPNHILPLLDNLPMTATDQIFHTSNGVAVTLSHVTHHLSHCANSYFLSGFEDAAIFSCDAYGERASSVWAVARSGGIEVLRETEFPHSLGSFYSAVCEFLGFSPDHDEWKVMGAAAYGDPEPYYPAMERLVLLEKDGTFRLDLSYFNHFNFDSARLFTPKMQELLGSPRSAEDKLEQRHFDIAAAAQKRIEDALMPALVWLKKTTGMSNLCMAGGVAMNSVFNGKATLDGPFENVYVPFAPDDSGNSIGAAFWTAWRHGDKIQYNGRPASPFIGGSHENDDIRKTLEGFGLPFKTVDDPSRTAAELIAGGKIIGWFQGRMEFGQRALGGRSILADPRDATMKERINKAVKFRESFRPFAPAVLASEAHKYFAAPKGVSAPYMEKVLPVRPEKQDEIPAVVHADGTGRLQTVEPELNPEFHGLIEAFRELTGIPVVLNTSFNLSGEAIVESPVDAVRTFAGSGMDALVIGRHMLTKEPHE